MVKRTHDERGAALVEFALILPIFMMLVLGMFTGGLAYSTKLSLNGASREGGRYGATLPVKSATCSGGSAMARWLQCVADAAIQSAGGDLDAGQSGRSICVAYVYPSGSASDPTDATQSLTITNTGTTFGTSQCFTDGLSTDTRRVQVRVVRTENLEVMVFSRPVTLTSNSTTRFEATA